MSESAPRAMLDMTPSATYAREPDRSGAPFVLGPVVTLAVLSLPDDDDVLVDTGEAIGVDGS